MDEAYRLWSLECRHQRVYRSMPALHDDKYEIGDNEQIEMMHVADVATSEILDTSMHLEDFLAARVAAKHAPVLDLDEPHVLAESTLVTMLDQGATSSLLFGAHFANLRSVVNSSGLGFVRDFRERGRLHWHFSDRVSPRLWSSTTDGHAHLYLDVSLEQKDHDRLMVALAGVGVLEPGFTLASLRRGYSSARLPWIRKTVPNNPKSAVTMAELVQVAEEMEVL